jgi:subtilase family serine protease
MNRSVGVSQAAVDVSRLVIAAGLALGLAASSCASNNLASHAGRPAVTTTAATTTEAKTTAEGTGASALGGLPALNVAEREARDLGPVPPNMTIGVTLTLRGRDPAGLQSLVAGGKRVTPAAYAVTYGPSPEMVSRLRHTLARAGISSRWLGGEVSLSARAPAAAIEKFFHVGVHNFLLNGNTRFYAPLREPGVPVAITGSVLAVTGLDNYPSYSTFAIPSTTGLTPSQVATFYNLTPLRNAGIDGTGVTVMFPEWVVPDQATLDAFAKKFNLPPFNVSVQTNPTAWGAPATSSSHSYWPAEGEATMDLEIVHGLAPGAKEVVYSLGNPGDLPLTLEAMVRDHPGAVMSSSIGNLDCELEAGAKQDSTALNAVFEQAAGEGISIFWASGDRGAFACLPGGDPANEYSISVDPGADSPYVTGVGGTTAFASSTGAYYKEAAWGEPVSQWGSGGGVSTFYPRPSWQDAPGTTSLTGRGVPDVAADADGISGWDTFSPTPNGPVEGPNGGTSAAAPCWASVAALIDQYLMQQHLRTVGFANPALYLFARDPKVPAPPFHQITEGTNLHYPAAPGWNPATGLGSPDAAHLADDFAWYDRTHASG